MFNLLWVGIAAGFGSIIRYIFSFFNEKLKKIHFPLGTFMINMFGCFILGKLYSYFGTSSEFYKILGIGFCGGLTTFSTYNFELYEYIEYKEYIEFIRYFLSSYGLGLIFLFLGLII